MRMPGTVRVLDAHVEHTPVTVEILDTETVRRVFPRIRPNARADEATLLETRLGPVRVQARDDIEGTSVERARHELVLAMSDEQPVNEVERRRAPRPLHRMDVGFDQERRLVDVCACLGVR